jgi:hypothetical protein
VPRVYRADHTAHIRERLRASALHHLTGLIAAGVGAGGLLLLQGSLREAHPTVVEVGWWLDRALATIAGLGLALTAARYLRYRRRRADLDAAGAEVLGEFLERQHRGPDRR